MPTTLLARRRQRQGGYLSKMCPELIAKDNMPLTYPEDLKEPYSAFTEDLFASGNAFEDAIGQQLAERVPVGELAMIHEERAEDGSRTKEAKDAKERDTFAAYLDPKVRVIFNARIGPVFEQLLTDHLGVDTFDHDRISEPDLIELGDTLPNGLRAMRFIDIKWHKITQGKTKNPKILDYSTLDAPYRDAVAGTMEFYGSIRSEDWRQLAHYYRHARTLGLAPAEAAGGAWAGVIGKEEVVVWADLDTLQFTTIVDGRRTTRSALAIYDADFADGLAIVDNSIARDTNPDLEPLHRQEWSQLCGECPWRTVCLGELREHGRGGHITLLPGVTPSRAKPLYARGITDVASLARQDPLGPDEGVPAEHIYTARVALDGRAHLALDVAELTIPRADIEVDFDCESEDTVYMWGVRVTDRVTGQVTMHTFDDYTGSDDGELAVFVDTWDLFRSLSTAAASAGRSIRFYHYTAYERTQMLALARKYEGRDGVPPARDVVEFFDSSGAVVDLYQLLSTQVVWPTMSHSIKQLAVFTGFSWRDQTPGGDMSMVWYRSACNDPDPQVRQENVTRLRHYNEDDVAAQEHLRNWAGVANLPSVTDLPAPTD